MFALAVTAIELALLRARSGYWIGAGLIALGLLYRAWRRNAWERKLKGFVYEERPDWAMARLDLQP